MSTILNLQEFEAFQKRCNLILQEPNVRFAGLISQMGNLLIGGFKEGIKPMENDAERQKMYMELALRVSMRKDFDYSLGEVKFSASRRENAVMISFPIKKYVLLVSAETSVDIEEFGKKVLNILEHQSY